MKQRFAGIMGKKRTGLLTAVLCVLLMGICGACGTGKGTAPSMDPSVQEKPVIENQWAAATLKLREAMESPAFVDAPRLCYVESIKDSDLYTYTIYREEDGQGGQLPGIMFSEEDDPISIITVAPDVLVELMSVEQDSAAAVLAPGAPADIHLGSVISAWGGYDEADDVFTADHVVIWITEGNG